MQIKGYDDWKLATPWDDKECCPFCGAWTQEACEMEDFCSWEMSEPDPDYLNDLKADRNP